MASRQLDEEAIFHVARRIDDREARGDYLDQVCAGDQSLRERVEHLLNIYEREGEFLKSSADPGPTEDLSPISERPGQEIGRYKLLAKLGEGGMGTVFMAEQLRPIKRRVAVKIIKQGMDTQQFVARFEAERQALALMDHPNIARVLDAGCTDTGRPYFVMELVKVPITQFCDENRLTARQRVELFVSVCHAVQHAHQKGIIHRDLKPSNVLVALYDDKPVSKIIDFGVAKATNQQLTERTLFTQVGQIVGTWEYMSPEQAVLNQLDVDTRTDIYSLGVILYELLTGVTPLDSKRLRAAALEETLRLIREEDPPKPSNRISSLGETATATAAYRGTDVSSLARTIRGDMDWIVMKALEKDRPRRYETANAMAADLDRYLEGEAIEARPPSTVYRLGKIASRHRPALIAAAAVMAALVAGVVISTGLAVQMYNEREAAHVAQQEAEAMAERLQTTLRQFQYELLDRAFSLALAGDITEVEAALVKAREAEAPDDLVRTIQGIGYIYSGDSQKAITILEDVLDDSPDSLAALCAVHLANMYTASFEEITSSYEHVGRAAETVGASDHALLLLAETKVYAAMDIQSVVRDLDRIINRHPRWGTAYAIRARVKAQLVQETMSIATLEDAAADAELAIKYLPNNPYPISAALEVHNYLLELAAHKGLDTAEYESRAKELASDLETWPGFNLWCRMLHYKLVNEEDKLLAMQEASLARGDGTPQPELATLLLEDVPSKLLEFAERDPTQVTPWIAVAIRYALDGYPDKAIEVFERLENGPAPTNTRMLMLDIPSVLQRPDLAKSSAEKILERLPENDSPSHWRYEVWQAEYIAGRMTKEELLRRAGPFSMERSGVHWLLGMDALAHGNDEEAKTYLEIAADFAAPGCWGTAFSKAYLTLMRQGRLPVRPTFLRDNKDDHTPKMIRSHAGGDNG